MTVRAVRSLLLVIGLAAAVFGAILLASEDGPPPRVDTPSVEELAPGSPDAHELARRACVHVRLASQGVQANAAAANVRRELASARALAAAALRQDARYAPLSGGVASLDEAVRTDDANAALVGMQVALDECEGRSG